MRMISILFLMLLLACSADAEINIPPIDGGIDGKTSEEIPPPLPTGTSEQANPDASDQ